MIKSFANKETQLFWETGKSKKLPTVIVRRALDSLQMLDAAYEIEDLRFPPSNRLEKLKGDWRGYWSIRINGQYRVVFQFSNGIASAVSIVDYH